MIRSPWRFLASALVVAWAVDFLFWKKPPGVSFLIWTILVIGGSLLLAVSEKRKPSAGSFLLMAVIISLAFVCFLRRESFTQGFSFLFALFLIGVLAATFLNGHWIHFRAIDYLIAGFNALVAGFSRSFDLSKQTDEQPGNGKFQWRMIPRKIMPVLRGLVLALPVVLVLAALLSSADPIFSDQLKEFFKFFDLDRLVEYLFRFFYIVTLAYLFIGLYMHALYPKREAVLPDPQKPWIRPFLGWTETAVILVSVNILFALFLGIQFRYFFGGQANISETGYTYAEYARRGFGELVAVAVLSLMLYLGLGTISRQEKTISRRGFSILSILLVLQVVVMLVSAYQRLLLYENAYGFTRLRTYSHVFMVWLGAVLGAAVVLEVLRRRWRFALVLLTAAFGFSLTLAALNVDGFVVRQNVQRTFQGYELDAQYLKELSSDAIPQMARLYRDNRLTAEPHRVLGAELACRTVLMQDESRLPWQGYTLSQSLAVSTLTRNKNTWEEYPVSKVDGEWMVQIGDDAQACRWSGWD